MTMNYLGPGVTTDAESSSIVLHESLITADESWS